MCTPRDVIVMEKRIKTTIYICVTISLVTVASEVVIILTTASPKRQDSHTICLPDSTGNMACGSMADRLTGFLSKAIEDNYDAQSQQAQEDKNSGAPLELKEFPQDHPWDMKPAARVTGVDQPMRPNDHVSELTPIRNWEVGRNGYTRYGVIYRDGRLVVPVSGTYMIYCLLDMYEEWNKTADRPVHDCESSIRHTIYKYNILDGAEEELMCSERPHQISSNGYHNIYTSYLSSCAKLKSGDEIYVKVTDKFLLTNPRMNFFGMHMV